MRQPAKLFLNSARLQVSGHGLILGVAGVFALPCTIQRTLDGWLFTWDVDSGTYDIWLNGNLLTTVTEEEYECQELGYDSLPPPIEIVNQGDEAINSFCPPFLILQWRRQADADTYIVQEKVGTQWVDRCAVREDGTEYYVHATPVLADCTQAQWRVIALNFAGDPSTPLQFTTTVVRIPDPPEVGVRCHDGDLIVESTS